ncbi:cytochrome b/b6 domain-containing protein [Sphingorhabdus arenilitoris]|uniref:Cytochrome b/b6 domain-containing protein n=1 Tax=Sphingorhabdus arenilitoris TaxID=1490041 RepID=A0ABV8RG94_9SPHN
MSEAHKPAMPPPAKQPSAIRHPLTVRLWHWANAAALMILLMSGLMIFNAHPRLYWGEYGAHDDPAWFEIGDDQGRGFIQIGDRRLDSTGILGVYEGADGTLKTHAFPYWATIPSEYSLADARLWHLAFAWIFSLALMLYLIAGLLKGHIRDSLHITRQEWRPAHIWQDIKDHLRLRFAKGDEAGHYNILQKFSYIAVIFLMLPMMIFTGLAMSPAMNAAWPWLIDIFGGRQSARSLHFLIAFSLIGFFAVHMVMVLLAGPVKHIRAMVTGRPPRNDA